MEEPQKPKKSWISYWIIALCVFLLLQAFVFPNLFKGRVKEVGYETFISMTENKEIGSVTIESINTVFWRLDHLLEKSISHMVERVLPLKSTAFSSLMVSIFSELNIHTQ